MGKLKCHGLLTWTGDCPQAKPRLQRGGSSASLHNTMMRNSVFQLMIHTLDPLSDGTAHFNLYTTPHS